MAEQESLAKWELEFAQGSEEAFDFLCKRTWGAVLAVVRASRRNGWCRPEDAEDIALQAFVRAWQRRAQFDPQKGSFQAWVCGIAAYIKLGFLRSAKRYILSLADVEPASLFRHHHDPERSDPQNPFAALLGGEIEAQLCQLPDALRETANLVWVQGYSYEEAAQKLGVPTNTVGTRLHSARKWLKKRPAFADFRS